MSTVKSPMQGGTYFVDAGCLQVGEALVRDGDFWLHFSTPAKIVVAERVDEVVDAIASAESHVASGGWAIGFVAYDAGAAFDSAVVSLPGRRPMAWFALHREPPSRQCELTPIYHRSPVCLGPLELDSDAYRRRFKWVKNALERGETYQVNLTMRQPFRLGVDAATFFAARCGVQPPPFATYIQGGEWQVASFSPELFFERIGTEIESRPMKGTAVRPDTPQEARQEAQACQALAADPKSIAENIMIVDMVRNDLGSVAEPGSVHVPKLLQVERHRTLLQMTSTVRGTTSVSTVQLFRSLFPPASVTGAPKVATCRLIAELEGAPRGVYCGAIGFIAPGRQRFSVAIRTAWLDTKRRTGDFGIGSGIVWDSNRDAEYAECLAKRDFLVNEGEQWALVEALPREGLRDATLVAAHMARLERSAEAFGIAFDPHGLNRALSSLHGTCPSAGNKVRVRLRLDGSFDVTVGPSALPAGPLTATLASAPVDSMNPNLRFKTTARTLYERHLDAHPGVDEVLLYNEAGELTEFCRGNVVLKLEGRLVTPDPSVGCLPGIGVARLVGTQVAFGRPTVADLGKAAEFFFVNSVVGMRPIRLTPGAWTPPSASL
ncbi:MAG: chorismate-binding protein [Fimbriimonadaceae bacterium]